MTKAKAKAPLESDETEYQEPVSARRWRFLRSIDKVSYFLAVLAGVAIVLMVANIIIDVVGRALFRSPVPGTLELVTFVWMPSIVFLALAFAESKSEHIRVSVIIEGLRGRVGTVFAASVGFLGSIVIVTLVYYGFDSAIDAYAIGESAVGTVVVPVWPSKIVMVVGLVAFGLQSFGSLCRIFLAQQPEAAARPSSRQERTKGKWSSRSSVVLSLLSGGLAVAIFVVPGPREATGVLVILLMLMLMLIGLPISLSMVGASILGILKLAGPAALTGSMKELVFSSAASWSLSVIPAFILMGIALGKSGLTTKAFTASVNWIGGIPGGLAVGTNFASAGLAAASGSSVGITYALGRVAIPEMLKRNYRPSLAAATVAAGGTLGQIIPPSILLVVYAGVAQTPVGPQLTAAIVPGVILATLYAAMIVIRSVVTPSLAPRQQIEGVTWRKRWSSLTGILPIVIVVTVVIGGLLGGLMTPTEAGALGATIALMVGYLTLVRSKSPKGDIKRFFTRSLIETTSSVASIFALLIGVYVLTRVMTLSRVTNSLADWIVSLGLGVIPFLMIVAALYLVLGMFLDPLAMILLTIPVLSAPLAAFGIDMIWFGVFVVVVAEVAQISPPVGLLCFVVYRLVQNPEINVGKRITLREVYGGVSWFILVSIVVLVLITVWPELVSWLPGFST